MPETRRSRERRTAQEDRRRPARRRNRSAFPLVVSYATMGLSEVEKMSDADYAARVEHDNAIVARYVRDNKLVKLADPTVRHPEGREV